MWTKEYIEDLIENATIIKHFKDNEFVMVEMKAHDGYAIHFKEDNGFTDEEGIYYPPSYSKQLITAGFDEIYKYEIVAESTINKEKEIA